MVSATRPDEEGQVQLRSMWGAPWARGRGMGDALIAEVIKWSNDQRATRLVLSVVEGMIRQLNRR
jgi:hypothetical protein